MRASGPIRRIGVVVVDFHGGERTLRCLRRLAELHGGDDRIEVVLVDNGSPPGFAAQAERSCPGMRVIATGSNIGFGAACNIGIDALRAVDAIALLNNDARPEAGWLAPLSQRLASPGVGAATPKVVLADPYQSVRLLVAVPRTTSDPRTLGVQLCGAEVGNHDVLPRVALGPGFWTWEHGELHGEVAARFAWSTADATFHLPVSTCGPPRIRLACGLGPVEVRVVVGDHERAVSVGAPTWIDLPSCAPRRRLVNNVGTSLVHGGDTRDRGFLAPDDGRFDDACEVFGWSGAAVLLSRAFLDDVGPFDESFFLYYEDSDLSWRGRLRGWSYWYEPSSVVAHEHSATVDHTSALVTHLSRRNRLAMLTKNAPRATLAEAVRAVVAAAMRAAGRDVVLALVLRRPVRLDHTVGLLRALGAWARRLPTLLQARRRLPGAAARWDVVRRWTEPVSPEELRTRVGGRAA